MASRRKATRKASRKATPKSKRKPTARTPRKATRKAPRNTASRTARKPGRGPLRQPVFAPDALREMLAHIQGWREAHAGFEHAVSELPADLRGRVPEGLPYSAWQLLEHLRLAQHDILDFCRNPAYEEMKWPDDYWPRDPAPPSADAWDKSVRAYLEDRNAFEALARDRKVDLFARIPHGSGQTYLRELLLAADHAAYHVGEIVTVRRLLGAWPPR